jgi:DNA-binding NtrC family response regulator
LRAESGYGRSSDFGSQFKTAVQARASRWPLCDGLAQSAFAALQRIAASDAPLIILVLSDINMPEMSGLEFLPKAKAIRPDIPVIMITAYGDAETTQKA